MRGSLEELASIGQSRAVLAAGLILALSPNAALSVENCERPGAFANLYGR
jgi:hypothetical protein